MNGVKRLSDIIEKRRVIRDCLLWADASHLTDLGVRLHGAYVEIDRQVAAAGGDAEAPPVPPEL